MYVPQYTWLSNHPKLTNHIYHFEVLRPNQCHIAPRFPLLQPLRSYSKMYGTFCRVVLQPYIQVRYSPFSLYYILLRLASYARMILFQLLFVVAYL